MSGRISTQLHYHISNPRLGRIYGFSPVKWVIMTVNIALRRQVGTWDRRDYPLKSLEFLFPRPSDTEYLFSASLVVQSCTTKM